jgi:hypothetical protein
MSIAFFAHNILLGTGEQTSPGAPPVDQCSWLLAGRDILRATLSGPAAP